MVDNVQQESIKLVGTVGTVMAESNADSGKGLIFDNGAVVFDGSKGVDIFIGSEHDDIMLTNGVQPGAIKKGSESVFGKDGHDTVLLPSVREDYIAIVPEVEYYPNLKSPDWQDTNTLYGRVVLLENVKTEAKYQLNGVESVVFDNGNSFSNPKVAAMELGSRIKDGSVSSVSTETLFKQAESALDPEDIHILKIHGSREANAAYSDQRQMGMDKETSNTIISGIVEKLDAEGIDVDERPVWKADDPKSDITIQAYDLGIPTLKM